jgi:hypothetical protein
LRIAYKKLRHTLKPSFHATFLFNN